MVSHKLQRSEQQVRKQPVGLQGVGRREDEGSELVTGGEEDQSLSPDRETANRSA